jgi:serine/threonine protein kinase
VGPELLRALPLTLRQRLVWLRQVALGVAVLHKHGLLHGNLRPANVMLAASDGACSPPPAASQGSRSSQSRSRAAAQAAAALATAQAAASPGRRFAGRRGCVAVVADFGLQAAKKASLAGPANAARAARVFKGWVEAPQLPYCAPEVLQGGALTQAADVFAFSVLCWEVLVGRPPHAGKSPEATMKFTLEKKRLALPSDHDLAQR